mmetsp:Transcript_6203/g.9498  ORF Transcript_6203/g.9498 Transcript_6203/m.9498 type:complete len:183 (+) Transcript_6203:546-1094(+)
MDLTLLKLPVLAGMMEGALSGESSNAIFFHKFKNLNLAATVVVLLCVRYFLKHSRNSWIDANNFKESSKRPSSKSSLLRYRRDSLLAWFMLGSGLIILGYLLCALFSKTEPVGYLLKIFVLNHSQLMSPMSIVIVWVLTLGVGLFLSPQDNQLAIPGLYSVTLSQISSRKVIDSILFMNFRL